MRPPLSLFPFLLLLALVHFGEVGAVRNQGKEPGAPAAQGQAEAERQGVQGNEAVQQPHLLPPDAVTRHGQLMQEAVQQVVANLDPTGRESDSVAHIALLAIQTYRQLLHEKLRPTMVQMGLALDSPAGQHAPSSVSEYQQNQLNPQPSSMQVENAGTSAAVGPTVSPRPHRRGRGHQSHNLDAAGQSEANTISGTPVVRQGLPSQPIGVQGEHPAMMGQHHWPATAGQQGHSVPLVSTLAQHRSSAPQPPPSPALVSQYGQVFGLLANSNRMSTLNAIGGGQTQAQLLLQQQQWAAAQAHLFERQNQARQMSMLSQRDRVNRFLLANRPSPLQVGEAGPTTLGGAADHLTALQLGTRSAAGREQGRQTFTRLQPATGATASAVVPSPTASQFQRHPSFRNIGQGMGSTAEFAEFQQQLAMAQPSATGGQASANSHHQSNAGVAAAGAPPTLLDLLSPRAAIGHQPPALTSSHQPVSLEGHDPNAANPSTSGAVGFQLFPPESGNEAAEAAAEDWNIPIAKRPRKE